MAAGIRRGRGGRHSAPTQHAQADGPTDAQPGERAAAATPQPPGWWQTLRDPRWVAGIAAVVVYVGCFVGLSRKHPFAGHVCLTDGAPVFVVFIGEASQRTYLGEPKGPSFSRIISIPQSQIQALYVGPPEAPAPCATLRPTAGG
jgi:hypothetical protein